MAAPRSLTPSSFEASLVAQAPAVTRRLRALVGDRETAEDLCQEALSRAWRVPSLQGDPERLRAWLLRTARNLAIDELRRRGRRDHVGLTDDLPRAPAGGDAYRTWLEGAGARVRMLVRERPGIDLVGVDAIVLTGSVTDVHPGLYGQRPGTHVRYRDERDLAILRAALRADVPILGVCRGTQLLNILAGGDLVQHLDAAGPFANHGEPHTVESAAGSLVRGPVGAQGSVCSIHHQAVGRLGRGLRVAARAPRPTATRGTSPASRRWTARRSPCAPVRASSSTMPRGGIGAGWRSSARLRRSRRCSTARSRS
jgi:RNA polymerase sigma factor (sigma-70 family)